MEGPFSGRRMRRDIFQGSVRRSRESPFSSLTRTSGNGIFADGFVFDNNSCNCLVVVCVLGLSGYYMYANKQADRGKKVLEGSEAFRYTI